MTKLRIEYLNGTEITWKVVKGSVAVSFTAHNLYFQEYDSRKWRVITTENMESIEEE
jgi:hypothetical protein